MDSPGATDIGHFSLGEFPGSQWAYFRQQPSGSAWHAVSEEPISDPPQPSITVKMSDRDNWGGLWEEQHEHAQPGDEGCGFAPRTMKTTPAICSRVAMSSDRKHRGLWCVSASAKEYVTVHDYVSAVHPWSMSHFDVISSAANVWEEAPAG